MNKQETQIFEKKEIKHYKFFIKDNGFVFEPTTGIKLDFENYEKEKLNPKMQDVFKHCRTITVYPEMIEKFLVTFEIYYSVECVEVPNVKDLAKIYTVEEINNLIKNRREKDLKLKN